MKLLALGTLAFLLQGCASMMATPTQRIGALPCPGPFTLYALADPGEATYDRAVRGILYSSKAGFLDLAHILRTLDWTQYAHAQVEPALRSKKTEIEFPGIDLADFSVRFSYPTDWDAMPAGEREALAKELAIQVAERVAFDAMMWHEIITWYGFKTVLVGSEKRSAFTYDDTISHVIGTNAGDWALRHPTGTWGTDAAQGVAHALRDVKVMPLEAAQQAVYRVEGQWWANGSTTRRMLDVGQHSGVIQPWLVRGMPGSDAHGTAFPVPGPKTIGGRDFSGLATLLIRPSLLTPSRVREITPGQPEWIDARRHFPVIVDQVRKEFLDEFGPHADQPYDDL